MKPFEVIVAYQSTSHYATSFEKVEMIGFWSSDRIGQALEEAFAPEKIVGYTLDAQLKSKKTITCNPEDPDVLQTIQGPRTHKSIVT